MKTVQCLFFGLLITAALAASMPLRASAQTYYAAYDGPVYGTRVSNGQVFYYLLPSQGGPVYYNGAIYPTGYPGGAVAYGYGYALASALSVACTAIPLSAKTNEEVLWYSSVTGGAGNYQYFWSGTDGLSARASTVRKAYSAPGEKFATVTVTSGAQSVTVGCNRAVTIHSETPALQVPTSPAKPELRPSCFALPEKIAAGESATWFATASGLSPTEPVTYEWQGADGLVGAGPSVRRVYEGEGQKYAIVTVISGTARATTACTNSVTVAPKRLVAAVSNAKPSPEKSATPVAPIQPDTKVATKTAAPRSPENAVPESKNPASENGEGLLAAVFSGVGLNVLCLILGVLLAASLGVILALWRQKQELEQENQNHK